MLHSFKFTIVLVVFIVVFFTSGCYPFLQNANDSNGLNTSTPIITPVFTEKPTPSETEMPPFTPTQAIRTAQYRKPTPTIIIPMSPTWTPAPTLSLEKALVLVGDLLENIGGCDLPCWWGMVPGKTDWNQARHFLETFAVAFEQGGEGEAMENGKLIYSTNYDIKYQITPDIMKVVNVGIQNGEIEFILALGYGTKKSDLLNQLLTNYGLPDYVWLQTIPYGPTTAPPIVDLIVYYSKKGFWAHYQLVGEIKGDFLQACPQSTHPILYLWPTKEWTFDDLFQQTLGQYSPDTPKYTVLGIKEATSKDIEEFYNTFKNPGNKECIETPLKLWP